MRERQITQTQALELVRPLFEYLDIDEQDVSVVKITAGGLDIEHRGALGSVTTRIKYTSIGG